MAMFAGEIVSLIEQGVIGAKVEIVDLAGDGDHYEARVTAEAFRGKTRLQQHQLIYQALGGRVGQELHALAIKTYLPEDNAGI